MKKEKGVAFGKKLLSLFLAMAMVITMFQLPGTATAYAAGTAVKLYFELARRHRCIGMVCQCLEQRKSNRGRYGPCVSSFYMGRWNWFSNPVSR